MSPHIRTKEEEKVYRAIIADTDAQLAKLGTHKIRDYDSELTTVREPKRQETKESGIEWDNPVSIKAHLDRFVYDQEDAKRALSVAFADYMSLGKPSHTLLIGPSGTGKTFMLSILCDAAGIPFVKKSMANVSSEGYRGENLSDVLYALSGEQIIKSIHPKITHPMFTETVRHLPGRAIVFLDELDKIAMNGNSGTTGDVFPCKLQQELLAWFSGETVHGVDMSKYLMVGAGAFSGSFGRKSLYQIIQQRVGGSQSQLKSEQLLENLVDADLIEYGFNSALR